MLEILKIAKKEYPRNSLFISASKLLKSPIRVGSLKISENYERTITNDAGGIIAIASKDLKTITWAEKI